MGGQTKTAPTGAGATHKAFQDRPKMPPSATAAAERARNEDCQRRFGFTADQVLLLKRTLCKPKDREATDDELALFLTVAKRHKLDPFKRQIHAVFRYDKRAGREVMVIQTGIGGYRSQAASTGFYAGNDDIQYDREEGDHPAWARATVYRLVAGQRIPFTATARWAEFAQIHPTEKWAMGKWASTDKGGMPWNQLGKCAEALALRKAFPDELSGIYVEDELHRSESDAPAPPTEAELTPPPVGEERPEATPAPEESDPPAADDVAQAPPEKPTLPASPAAAVAAIPETRAFGAKPSGELRIPPGWPDWKMNPITEKQAGRIYAIQKQAGLSDDQVQIIIGEFGYTDKKQILVGHYDDVCNRILPGSNKPKSGGGGR